MFNNAIDFAKQHHAISFQELEIILQARKTLLFHEGETWVKKSGNEDFDVTMGCFNGAEVCELVGTYILSKIESIINKQDVGLYRDDGLGILRNLSGPRVDRKRKEIMKIFRDCGLSITIQINITIVGYLDIQLNLNNTTFKPYRKLNNNSIYISTKSQTTHQP